MELASKMRPVPAAEGTVEVEPVNNKRYDSGFISLQGDSHAYIQLNLVLVLILLL